jgi:hypothetical protein
MFYDFSLLLGWLIIAAGVGIVVGWRAETDDPQAPWFHGWFRNSLIALAAAAVISIFHIFPGGLGFWTESAVMFYIVYLLGCLGGGELRRRRT